MDLKQSQQIRKYIDIILRRKVLIIAFLLISVAIGLIVTVTTPKQYRATALLSYQEQKINLNKMSPDVQAKIRDMVSTLSQIVTSRTNLEKVIKQFNLYGVERNKFPMEDVIDLMRNSIEIKTSSKGDIFSISYMGVVPQEVAKVTNSLAASFIEENLKSREERANETSSYAKNELQMAKVILDKKEDAMRDYKLKNYNEMPEQREGNLARLNSLQQQYQGKQSSIQDLERTRVMVQEQMTARRNLLAAMRSSTSGDGVKEIGKGIGQPDESDAQRLERMKMLHNSLLMKYTDKHPDVIRVRKIIEKLEQSVGSSNNGPVSVRKSDLSEVDPVLTQLTLQMKKIDMDIDNLNKEKQQSREFIKKYEEWVSASPIREAEWTALTREYGQLKLHYDSLVGQDLQAESVVHIEQKQKGSQFKIEDNARLPEMPFKPNFYKIMGIAMALGLLSGCVIALGESILDSSFKVADDVETFLDLPVVCSIPFIYTEIETRRKKMLSFGWTITFILSVIILGLTFFHFWQNGQISLKFDQEIKVDQGK